MRKAPVILLATLCLLWTWRTTALEWRDTASSSPPPASTPLQPSGDGLCPPLPLTGNFVHVATVDALVDAVNRASPGDTILIADGTYALNGAYLRVDTANMTLRSASGNRDAVVLDGNYDTTEIVQIVASNITIADLTLRKAQHHPVHVMTNGTHTLNTLIYNVQIVDPGQQAIKINPADEGYYPDGGTIACSRIELTDSGRAAVWNINGSCYTGGVDAHQARDWTIRDSEITGFWCPNGLSEHGIHLWRGCRDTIVERNVLRDNARGIGFGLAVDGEGRTYPDNPCPGAEGGYVDHFGGVIRNNIVFASSGGLFGAEYGFDCGICLAQACGAWVGHNSVAATQAPFSGIEWRFANTDVDLVNNLLTHNLLDRGGTARLSGNLAYQSLSLFVDGAGGDVHLASTAAAAIDRGVPVGPSLCDDDIDGDTRPTGSARDVGADEYGISPPGVVRDLRIVGVLTDTHTLTATLAWTAPTGALTTALRYAAQSIDDANWDGAALLDNALPGSAASYTASIPYSGNRVYFALKTENGGGQSGVSNNAFWPRVDLFLPVVARDAAR